MLMQNFKSASDLKISEQEFSAAISVLGMLERGELVHQPKTSRNWETIEEVVPMGFNMECSGHTSECGTVACIGGWIAYCMGKRGGDINHYVNSNAPDAFRKLFWGHTDQFTTTEQAATALRSFLMAGDPNWKAAVA